MRFILILENEFVDQLNLTTTATKYMTSEIDGLYSSDGTVSNNSKNDNSRTVNQTNNSPKSLSRLEIYRQTQNAV